MAIQEKVPVTTLSLFKYSPDTLSGLKSDRQMLELVRAQSIASRKAYLRYADTANARIDRISANRDSTQDSLRATRSSRQTSELYLRTRDLFSPMGASSEHIYQLFDLALSVNIHTFDRLPKGSLGNDEIKAGHRKQLLAALRKRSDLAERPEWFQDTADNWVEMLTTLSIIKGPQEPVLQNGKVNYHQDSHFYILRDSLPDWMTEGQGTIPDLDAVKQEIDDDNAHIDQLIQGYLRQYREFDQIYEDIDGYYNRANQLHNARVEHLYNFPTTFPRLLLLLDSLPYLMGAYEKKDIVKYTDQYTEEAAKPKTEDRIIPVMQGNIEHYAKDEVSYLRPENVGLWIETQLRKARILTSCQEPLPGLYVDCLRAILENPDREFHNLSPFRELNGEHPKGYEFLVYKFRPFTYALNERQRAYYDEWLQLYPYEPIDPFIMDFAESIAVSGGTFSSEDSRVQRNMVKNLEDLIKHTRTWLNRNWYPAFTELQKVLDRGLPTVPEQISVPTVPENERSNEQEFSAELTEKTQVLEKGELASWQIVHTSNPAIDDPKYWTTIGGESIEERTANLAETLRKITKLPISADILIRELENIAGSVDDPGELIRGARIVNGNRYRRREKGKYLRIFYQVVVDEENGKMIKFFLHKKEAMDYQGDRKYF